MDFALIPTWSEQLWLEKTLSSEDFYNHIFIIFTHKLYPVNHGTFRDRLIKFVRVAYLSNPRRPPMINLGGVRYRKHKITTHTFGYKWETLGEFFCEI